MLDFLKFQRNGQQNAPVMGPISGKLEKKSVFLAYCRDKTTICHDRVHFYFKQITAQASSRERSSGKLKKRIFTVPVETNQPHSMTNQNI
ncbi:hypothetical protein [uncultured Bilophila sp.]|uniref:hypothetical protein n=1 Tax=uncultured Bilophila sp. TaxID=529385 RepID=UPI0026708B49|nr:hypothetical protein [uncultured Bilophila sp.]